MGVTVAVMITKGGVGKSTLVMALAETLSVYHDKRVLIVDSDPQASVSSMVMAMQGLGEAQQEGRTIAGFLSGAVLEGGRPDWRDYAVTGVCDVDDARTVSLIPGSVQLALIEREVSAGDRFAALSRAIAGFIGEANRHHDLVLVDCPPGLSSLTEAWMQRADYHLAPTKPDYLGLHGLEVLKRFEGLSGENGFSRRLGVLVNMMDMNSAVDRKFHEVLMNDRRYRCFAQAIPDHPGVKHAALFHPDQRSFIAKYPGIAQPLRALANEMLARLAPAGETGHAGEDDQAGRAGDTPYRSQAG